MHWKKSTHIEAARKTVTRTIPTRLSFPHMAQVRMRMTTEGDEHRSRLEYVSRTRVQRQSPLIHRQ